MIADQDKGSQQITLLPLAYQQLKLYQAIQDVVLQLHGLDELDKLFVAENWECSRFHLFDLVACLETIRIRPAPCGTLQDICGRSSFQSDQYCYRGLGSILSFFPG